MIKISQINNKIKALKTFGKDTTEIEKIITKFNTFSCLNFTFREKAHSRYIAWLLNGKENHNFGDYFLHKFISNIEFTWYSKNKLTEKCLKTSTEVHIEANYMDILVENPEFKFVCVIENKILAPEGKKQLIDYREKINSNPKYDNYKKIFIFLTPDKREPKADKEYIPIGYSLILEMLKNTLEKFENNGDKQIIFFLNDYISIIENFIIPKTNIEQMLAKIDPSNEAQKYVDNRFELIKTDIRIYITNLITIDKDLKLISSPKSMTRFVTPSLQKIIPKFINEDPEYVFYFEFNNQDALKLKLVLIPSKKNHEIRTQIFNLAKNNKRLFTGVRLSKIDNLLKEPSNTLEDHVEFVSIFKDLLITEDEYKDFEIDEVEYIKEVVSYKFQLFKEYKLKDIESQLLTILN